MSVVLPSSKDVPSSTILLKRVKKVQSCFGILVVIVIGLTATLILMSIFNNDNSGYEEPVITMAAFVSCVMVVGSYYLLVPGAAVLLYNSPHLVVDSTKNNQEVVASEGGDSEEKDEESAQLANFKHRHSIFTTEVSNERYGHLDVEIRAGAPGTDIVEVIRNCVVGDNAKLMGPFGGRRITYMDYSASGRMLSFVEDYMRDGVLPLYANTHTETSYTGMQTTHFREEARTIVADQLNTPVEEYAIIFPGTGSTAAINKLMNVLGLWIPEQWKGRLNELINEEERPVVILGPYEHHSNEVSWRESIATVVVVDEGPDGHPNQTQIREAMKRYEHRPLKMGSFSAGSNVSGIIPPVQDITELLHAGGFFAFWDFAGSGSCMDINFMPSLDPATHIDAGFFSPHKFVGGPGSAGLLVARRELFRNKVPTIPGGGTVSMVTQRWATYEADPEISEDAGTPGILQAIRVGLAFQVKGMVGAKRIEVLQHGLTLRAIEAWEKNPNIELMGGDRAGYKGARTSTVAFRIRYRGKDGSSLFLHHHFVIQLLNDVYGIQGRGGCSCAAPYGERLAPEWARVVDTLRDLSSELKNQHSVKLGWARVNFSFFMDDATVNFAIAAVLQIADRGWMLLPQYQVDVHSGQFYHRVFEPTDGIRLLKEGKLIPEEGMFSYKASAETEDDPTEYLARADVLYAAAKQTAQRQTDRIFDVLGNFYLGFPLCETAEAARSFVLPSQAALDMGVTPPAGYDPVEMTRKLSDMTADNVLAASVQQRQANGRRWSAVDPQPAVTATTGRRGSMLSLAEQLDRAETLERVSTRPDFLRSRPRG